MSALWRLATFNLESLDERASGEDAFARRIASLRPVLTTLKADILCLQEVNAQGHGRSGPRTFRALDHLLEGTPYAHFHRANSVNPITDRPADVHNLVTLSRWPLLRQRQLFHDLVPVWRVPLLRAKDGAGDVEVRFDRPVLITEIAMPHGRLFVFNLHLRAPRAAPFAAAGRSGHWVSNSDWAEGFHLAALKRQGQALEVRFAVDEIFDADAYARIAVCGDVNADSFETPARILRGTPDEGRTELDARALETLDLRIAADERYSVIHDGRRVMLDHIFASPRLASGCARVFAVNDGLADEAHVEGPVMGSLHAPVVAQFHSD